jgi:hypothetical protein
MLEEKEPDVSLKFITQAISAKIPLLLWIKKGQWYPVKILSCKHIPHMKD